MSATTTTAEALPDLVVHDPNPAPEALYREPPPPDEYPVDALGSLLSDAARAIEEHTQAPTAVCAQAVLGAACLAVQGHADVVLPTKQTRPTSLFLTSVLPSGERKTATDDHAGGARRTRERELRERYEQDVESHRRDHLAWTREQTKILRGGADSQTVARAKLDALGPEPTKPLTPLLACPEPTYEGLCLYLAHGQPAVGIFSDEGGQFVGGHGMSDEARLRTAAGLSGLWDGEPIRRVRAGDGTMILPGRRVAMHLMMQPGVAARLLSDPDLLDQGLLSRMLVCAPTSRAGTRLWKEPTGAALAALEIYHERLKGIHDAPLPLKDGKQNELAPRGLPLSPEARALWIGFADANEVQLGEAGALRPVAGLANKLPEHAARIAAVLTLVDDLHAPEIAGEKMRDGIELVQHYAGEALRMFEAAKLATDLADAEKLRLWILNEWTDDPTYIGLPEIYQRGPNAVRNKRKAAHLVGILEDHGWLHELKGDELRAVESVAGVRRRRIWRIRRSR